MQEAYFVVPNKEKMISGLARVKEIEKALEAKKYAISRDFAEAQSLACVARIVLEGALKENE